MRSCRKQQEERPVDGEAPGAYMAAKGCEEAGLPRLGGGVVGVSPRRSPACVCR